MKTPLLSLIVAVVLLVGFQNARGVEIDCFWADSVDGDFGTSTYWTPSGPPALEDRAIFNQTANPYAVSFDSDHENNQLAVDGGDVTLDLSGYTYSLLKEWSEMGSQSVMIAQSPETSAKLTITNGNVSAKDCIIGAANLTEGELVIGSGAAWSALRHAVVIGDNGNGRLTVENGGNLLHGHGWTGGAADTGAGIISVNGLNSTWTVTGWFGLGQQGAGDLTVADQGVVEMAVCEMANGTDASATAHIDGKDALWRLGSAEEASLVVGKFGGALVSITNGGRTENAGDMRIGLEPGSTGIVDVTGVSPIDDTPSSLDIGRELAIGWGGKGDLNVTDGSIVNVHGICYVGNSPDGEGNILINGSGAALNLVDAGVIVLGASGKAAMSIVSGGSLSCINAMINGPQDYPAGMYIEGANSNWTLSYGTGTSLVINRANVVVAEGALLDNAGNLHMAETASEHCELHIQNNINEGGRVHVGKTMIVGMAGDAIVEVSGPGSELTVSGRGAGGGTPEDLVGLEIGQDAMGDMYVSRGAYASNNYITTVGSLPGGQGHLLVEGVDSLVQANYQLEVGRDGVGLVEIRDNGRLDVTGSMTHESDPDISDGSTGLALIGLRGTGDLNVISGGVFTSQKQIQIGVEESGTGALLIDGGSVETHKGPSASGSSGIIGVDEGSHGAATVLGEYSSWIQDGALNVGWSGFGNLSILNGGLVESQRGIVGRNSGSTGTVSVSGENARWIIYEDLNIGGTELGGSGSTANVTIDGGGIVQVGTDVSDEDINIWSGGNLSIEDDANLGNPPPSYNPDYLHINGGGLVATGNINLDANRGLTIGTDGATMGVAENMTLRILSLTAGEGDLMKNGPGTLVLAGTPSYQGATHIDDGLLQIDNSAELQEISGDGNLGIGNEFVNAEVSADRVSVGVLTIAAGSKLTIKPLSGGQLAGVNSLTSVPEPSVITSLVLIAIAAAFYGLWKK
jgi:T5SS/PEP-CTERM-associated repeat protein/autotransporter-associated beta strand protein